MSFKVLSAYRKSATVAGNYRVFDILTVEYRGQEYLFARRSHPDEGSWIQVAPQAKGRATVLDPALIALLNAGLEAKKSYSDDISLGPMFGTFSVGGHSFIV